MHDMVQNASGGRKSRGRPPKFVRADVIESAMEVFWRKGVDHVTLDDLEAAAGIDRSTLYNSFDGKTGLYAAAADRYVTGTIERIFSPLHTVEDGIEAVAQMLARLRQTNLAADHPPGCLIVNDLGSPQISRKAARRYRKALQDGLDSALGRATAQGAVDADEAKTLSRWVAAGVLGANLTSYAIGRTEAVEALDAMMHTVRTHATD